MLKWVIVIGLIWLVYTLYFKKKPLKPAHSSSNHNLHDNDMVQCSTCKIYVEVNEAILSNGKYYCSKECLRSAE